MNLSKSIDFFYNNIINTASQDESDNDSDLHIAATTLMHEHTEALRPTYKGSMSPRKGNVKHNRKAGHRRIYTNYFHDSSPLFVEHTHSDAAIACQEIFS
jgi:hypothetical protein